MKPRLFYDIAQEEGTADIYIFGDITSWPYEDSDVSAYRLANQIKDIPEGTNITVHINSFGGEVAEGLAIYNALRARDVTTVCDGFAASAASVIFAAGKTRIMNAASLLFIHNASCMAAGNSGEMKKAAEFLDTITSSIQAAYKESGVNLKDDELTALMDAETWIKPDDAVEWGFATEVAEETNEEAPAASVRKNIYDRITKKEKPYAAAIGFDDATLKRFEASVKLFADAADKVTNHTPDPADGENKGFFNFKSRKTAKEEQK